MKKINIYLIYNILKKETNNWKIPSIELIENQTHNPFKILLATILSARTKDEITTKAAKKLFTKPAICVDTHVHRITNRWRYIKTKTPLETEITLRKKLPKKYWIDLNKILVPFGQHICKPIHPTCNQCPIEKHCNKINVHIKDKTIKN